LLSFQESFVNDYQIKRTDQEKMKIALILYFYEYQ